MSQEKINLNEIDSIALKYHRKNLEQQIKNSLEIIGDFENWTDIKLKLLETDFISHILKEIEKIDSILAYRSDLE